MCNYEGGFFFFPVCFSRSFWHWNKDFHNRLLVFALVSTICFNPPWIRVYIPRSYLLWNEMQEKNILCTEGLFICCLHHTQPSFLWLAYYTNKKVSWFPIQYVTRPGQGHAVLARAGHQRNTPIGLDYDRVFPGHSAVTIRNKTVSLVHSFICLFNWSF